MCTYRLQSNTETAACDDSHRMAIINSVYTCKTQCSQLPSAILFIVCVNGRMGCIVCWMKGNKSFQLSFSYGSECRALTDVCFCGVRIPETKSVVKENGYEHIWFWRSAEYILKRLQYCWKFQLFISIMCITAMYSIFFWKVNCLVLLRKKNNLMC